MSFPTAIRVPIILSAVFALAVSAGGCADSAKNGRALPISKISFIQMPMEGTKMPAPRSLSFNRKGELMVLDDVGRVLIFSPDGELSRKWWMPDHSIGRPEGIIEMKDGRIAVSDTHYYRVVIFTPDGKVSKIFGKRGEKPGDFGNPVGIAEDDNGELFVCEYGENDRVQVFRPDGTFLRSFGRSGMGEGEFQRPSAVLLKDGKVFVADAVNNRIQVFDKQGKYLGKVTTQPAMYLPYDVKAGPDGDLYVVEYGNNRVDKISPDGKLIGTFKIADDGLKTPWGVAVAKDGRIFVADTGNRRIVVITP